MAKKNRRTKDSLPEGMSRRQAKLAARAAERAALEKDPRPFAGFRGEAELVALQEFIASGYAKVDVAGAERDIYLCSILPGAGAVQVREREFGEAAYVALQFKGRSHNPGRDLAYALNWARQARPGESLQSTVADGTQPELTELLDVAAELDVQVQDDFDWWFPAEATVPVEVQHAIQQANETVVLTRRVEAAVSGSAWFADQGGGKTYLRWIRVDEDENALLNALARIAARGELAVGEDTKFAGVFRTHGLIVPVWDLPEDAQAQGYAAELERVDGLITAELDNDAQLDPGERRQLENIKSRQVTIR